MSGTISNLLGSIDRAVPDEGLEFLTKRSDGSLKARRVDSEQRLDDNTHKRDDMSDKPQNFTWTYVPSTPFDDQRQARVHLGELWKSHPGSSRSW